MVPEAQPPDGDSLAHRVEEPESQHAELRTRSGTARGRRRRGRVLLAGILITLGALLAPVAVTARWVQASISETDRYLAIVSTITADPAVQDALRGKVTAAVLDLVDPDALTAACLAALGPGDPSPAARAAVRALHRSLVSALETVVAQTVDRVLASDSVVAFAREAHRAVHAQVTGVLAGESTVLVLALDGTLRLELGPVVDAVGERLLEAEIPMAPRVPAVDTTIVLASSPELARAQRAYDLLHAAAAWLPWASLVLLAGGVLLARRWSRGLMAAAVGVAVSTVLTLATVHLAAAGHGSPAAQSEGGVLVGAVAETLAGALATPLRLVVSLAVVVWLAAFLAGSSQPARAVRAGIGHTWRRLAARAATTGSDAT